MVMIKSKAMKYGTNRLITNVTPPLAPFVFPSRLR